MADNCDISARCSTKRAAVTDFGFDIRHHGSFRDRAKGQDISNSQSRILSSVDKLASVHSLIGDKGLGVEFESVWITEDNFC